MLAGQGKGEPGLQPAPKEVPQWRRDSEFSGKVRVLEWGGISRTTAQWPTRWVALYRGSLYVLPKEDANASPTIHNIWTNRCVANFPIICSWIACFPQSMALACHNAHSTGLVCHNAEAHLAWHVPHCGAELSKEMCKWFRRVVKLPEDACGGAKHVLAICLPTVEIAHAVQDGSSFILRFSSDSQVLPAIFRSIFQINDKILITDQFSRSMDLPQRWSSNSAQSSKCRIGSFEILEDSFELDLQMEEWRTQLQRSQRKMKELAGGADEGLEIDFDVSAVESETASTTVDGKVLGQISDDMTAFFLQ